MKNKIKILLFFSFLNSGCQNEYHNIKSLKIEPENKNVFSENFNDYELNFLNRTISDDTKESEKEIEKIKEKILKLDENAKNFKIKKTSLNDYYEVNTGVDFFYINKEASHMFIGQAIKLNENGSANFISEDDITKKRRIFVNAIEKNNLIKIESEHKKETLFIFTDITCPYCKKLHKDIEKITELGYEIIYIPYSRDNKNTELKNSMNKIWCSKNLNEYNNALENNDFFIKENKNNKDCSYLTDYYINIANEIDIIGTPFIITSKGILLGGYQNYSSFLMSINKI